MSLTQAPTAARGARAWAVPEAAEPSDAEVVDRIRAGETAPFEILMRRYNQRLFRVAWSILLDETEAEDVIQDAYVRAFEHLDQFEGRARFSTWLTKIAVHEATARRRKRRRQVPLDALETHAKERLMAGKTEDPGSAETRLHGRDVQELLRRALAALPSHYRQVFVLREVEGLSTAEAAEALGLSRTATKVRLFRARRHLQRELERLTAGAAEGLLAFAGARCDRLVAGVMARIGAG